MIYIPNSYFQFSLIMRLSEVYPFRSLKIRIREQSMMLISFKNSTFISMVLNSCSLIFIGNPSRITKKSLLIKFSSLPNRKSLKSRSSTSRPSQYPFKSKITTSPWPRFGMSRKISADLFLPTEMECIIATAQIGTRIDCMLALNLTQSSKIRWNSSKSIVVILFKQQSLDLDNAISLLRLPIISVGISSHSLNSYSNSLIGGPFQIYWKASCFQISNSHSQVLAQLTLNSNLRGCPWDRRLAASISLRCRIDLINMR